VSPRRDPAAASAYHAGSAGQGSPRCARRWRALARAPGVVRAGGRAVALWARGAAKRRSLEQTLRPVRGSPRVWGSFDHHTHYLVYHAAAPPVYATTGLLHPTLWGFGEVPVRVAGLGMAIAAEQNASVGRERRWRSGI
jgi:hypothetical protein